MHPIYRHNANFNKGFTLVELIVVMTLTGILAAGVAQFLTHPTKAYFDTLAYANLADRADTALKRISREVSHALPNSVRVSRRNGNTFLEFIPVKAAARYRAAIGVDPTDNPLDFTLNADSFDVLGPAIDVRRNDQLVIYNLGIPGADAYAGTNRRRILNNGRVNTVSFNGGVFPLSSPSRRFYVVDTATTFVCDMRNHELVMYQGYGIQPSQPNRINQLNRLANPRLLASNVSSCHINYSTGTMQRTAMVTLQLGLAQDQANVHLFQQITMMNSP